MANEYLKRTPTSTGNRRVWTWSGWVKISNLPVSGTNGDRTLFSATDAVTNGDDDAIRLIRTGITGANSLYWSSSEYNVSDEEVIYTRGVFRDVGGWMHIIFAKDTTEISSTDRIKIYVNGVRQQITESNAISQNDSRGINSLIPHAIGEHFGQVRYWNGEMTDVFFIDGQALTPDVFGFYKQGNGYISAGSTQATDFRPGQWVPKTPRVIKAQIERNGGFGVNGFYLPMNDSSNFGADFHTTPNSIITLKGEDLPQPRNGAPTTTDAYVSQLRTDPYAANLVLAVPGISGGTSSGFGDYSANIRGTGSNKTVTLQGGISIASTASYYGSAGNFDGSNDRLDFSSDADFALPGDFTMEMWVNWKSVGNGQLLSAGDGNNTNAFYWQYYSGQFQFGTQGVASDNVVTFTPVANQWYHIAAERKGTVLTQYVNGVAVGVSTNVTRSYVQGPLYVGWGGAGYINAYIQDVRFYKGVAKYKGGFDVPKPYTPVGIATWRAVPDTTANNFATLNPLASRATHTNGNLTAAPDNSVSYSAAISNFMVNSGKWYCELRFDEESTGIIIPGISELEGLGFRDIYGGTNYFGQSIESNDTAGIRVGVAADDGDIISMYMDLDSSPITCSFAVNGGSATTYNSDNLSYNYNNLIPGKTYGFVASDAQSAVTGIQFTFNFGQNPTFSGNTTAGTYTDSNGKGLFKYEPPSGFLALCEDNLPTPAIKNPGEYFKTVLWAGDGASGRSIVGVGFTPDLVWIKNRNVNYDGMINDSVRGAGYRLTPSWTGVEQNETGGGFFNSFDNDGFGIGSGLRYNASGNTFVAWCWRAGAGTTSTNTDGTIPSVVSVNQDAGFSIVSYTGNSTSGATVGHGLGKAPSFIILKSRGPTARSWGVYHKSIGNTGLVYLDLTNSTNTASFHWNNTSPTSSFYTLGNGSVTNSSENYIAYCWAEIEGFSKFGSYVGNGNADGPFVYCGFKPAWILIKKTDSSASWVLEDSTRNPTNPAFSLLQPNTSSIEDNGSASVTSIDFLSNGFKIRGNWADDNANTSVYIFAAFAESPFQTANAK